MQIALMKVAKAPIPIIAIHFWRPVLTALNSICMFSKFYSKVFYYCTTEDFFIGVSFHIPVASSRKYLSLLIM